MDAQIHLTEIYARLSISPIVAAFTVLENRDARDQGYFRARVILNNQDYLELAEYFVIKNEQIYVVRYRYQWMSPALALKRRWDNANHHPGTVNFPHHIHIDSETHIVSGTPLSVVQLLDILEQEFVHEI
jgi:hypothetical protein